MLNGFIRNPVATGAWLAAGGMIAAWYRGRLHALRDIKNELKGRCDEEADERRGGAQRSAMLEAFGGGIAWIVLFVILDALF